MTTEQQDRWNRIRHFPLDAPNASAPFSVRLAREQGWTPAYTARVVEEYRRFAFLAAVAGHGVTPSKPVDEAWHLHLLYTRNYWEAWCPEAVGRPLHHTPSEGTADDETRYAGWFEQTLASYRRLFGEEPPADVWSTVSAARKGARGWIARLLLAAPMLLSGCTEPANPLDWHGPAFLGLFATLYAVAFALAWCIRTVARGGAQGPPAADWRLHVYEQAFLNEGERLALATAIARLTAEGKLEVDQKTGRMRSLADGRAEAHALDRAVLRAAEATGGARYDDVYQRARGVLEEMERTLRRQGLWTDPASTVPITALALGVASLPLLLGLLKIGVGVSRDRPVGFLVMGCIVGLALNLTLLARPRRSRYGDRVLEELRETRPGVQYNRYRGSLPGDDLALGLALYGFATINAGEYAYLRPAVTPAASSGDGGSGCGGSSSCGGGGGCGGGCGGCGG